jgi:aminopeptidase N
MSFALAGWLRSLCLLAALILWPGFAPAETETEVGNLICGHGHGQLAAAAPESTEYRKYAPTRGIDIVHLTLDVTPDFRARTLGGRATLRFKPIARPLAELKLDGVDLRVTEVKSSAKLLAWQATDEHIIISFDPPIAPDTEETVTVVYSAEPRYGLYFRTPEMGYRADDAHLWTQGEPVEARHWFPSFDAPNEKFTSEVICRVREDMTVVSNGRLVSEEKDSSTGLKVVHWRQEKPHSNYLIALVAGYMKKIEGKHGDIPLAFYTPASEIDLALDSFKETQEMMAFFEKEIGVPYPWAKYDQACVYDFGWGGMENTTLTILNDRTLHPPEFEDLRDSRGLIAHELAHQWFGDLVTCKDWSHIWLNEGFATYYETLFDGHKDGPDELRYRMYQSARAFLSQPNDTNAIVRRDFNRPEDQFGFHAYPKGAWILHMLRHQLGDELYRRCIRTYLERYQLGNVVTDDLNKVIEELSGRSFDRFFDQYVYHAHHPELGVAYSWDDRTKLARLTIRQEQKLSEDVLLFQVPLTVRFKGKFGTIDRELEVKALAEDFYVPLPQAPEIVRIDPEVALLAKISFSPPTPLLLAQLGDKKDAVGRLIAAEKLGGKKEALGKLKEVLNEDPAYFVRLEAASALRAMPADDALPALLASTSQKNARVRREVVTAIAGFRREESFTNLLRVLREEKNPDIRATALTRLAGWSRPETRTHIVSGLAGTTFHNVIEEAAITAARGQDDPAYIPPLLELLGRREETLTTAIFVRGLDALAWLARNEEKKETVREFLVARVSSPRQRVRTAAMTALGTLGDARAIAVLEPLAAVNKETPERTAAEKALGVLRENRKPSMELGVVRSDVLNLQRENRELRKELDDLKKKLEALAPKGSAAEKEKDFKPAKSTRR